VLISIQTASRRSCIPGIGKHCRTRNEVGSVKQSVPVAMHVIKAIIVTPPLTVAAVAPTMNLAVPAAGPFSRHASTESVVRQVKLIYGQRFWNGFCD